MGRVFLALTRALCLIVWVIAPEVFAQSQGNNIIPLQGNGGNLKNLSPDQKVLLFTNLTASYRGKLYSFPNSTTAGLSELQGLFPRKQTPGPGGIAIQLSDNSEYTFSTPIFISNNVSIVGGGMWSSGFKYVGSTNVFGSTQALELSNVVANPSKCGLFTIVTNLIVQNPVLWYSSAIQNVNLKDFYIKASTNFPCYLMVGQGNFYKLDHVGFFGPDVLTTSVSGFGNMNPMDTIIPSGLGLIAAYFQSFSQHQQYGCMAIELADGFEYANNMVISAYDNAVYNMVFTNAYPNTNILSLGFGFHTLPSLYSGVFINNQDYKCGIPYVIQGSSDVNVLHFVSQSPSSGFVVGGFTDPNLLQAPEINIVTMNQSSVGANVTSIYATITNAFGTSNLGYSTTDADYTNNGGNVSIQITSGTISQSVTDGPTSGWNMNNYNAALGRRISFEQPVYADFGLNITGINGSGFSTALTNTLTVNATGVTNNQNINYLLTITAGTGLALKDNLGNGIINPVLNETVPLKPGWRFTGTGVTAQAIAQ